MDITTAALAITAASGLLAVILLVPLIRASLDMRRNAEITGLAHTYVYAAEQIFGPGNGKEKFVYVSRAMTERGFKLNEHEECDFIRASIESAVRELKYLENN